jgi:WbqC-like protein
VSKVVAIHQPNFLPWLGYFNKIAHADVFVVLDNVQFAKTGGTWTNRVRLRINNEGRWVTVPIVRNYRGVRTIAEMKIAPGHWRAKLLQTLQMAYGRARHFGAVFPFIEPLIGEPTDELVRYNLTAIGALAAVLGLDRTRVVLASELGVSGRGTDLLVALVKAVEGSAYFCGGGAGGYQEDRKYAEAGIRLVYQAFRHPAYDQGEMPFIPGLSIVDVLMHCGFADTRTLVHGDAPASAAPDGRAARPDSLLRA